ncbi:MAG: enoyl-CoA hydratase/isomerase family protein, partial [Candidatus Acidiferrales bacterium]
MGTTSQPAAAATLVTVERAGAVTIIRLNRPEKLNALNLKLAHELVHALLDAQADRAVHCVVITGAGRAFCAGGDLELLRDARQRKAADEVEALVTAGKEICIAIATMPKVVIASVNGPAAGGGMNLA